jgi:prolyl-tRNA synthetase
MIGSLIMTHGDDKGLILPPKIAHTHVVIVPIFYKEIEKKKVLKKAKEFEKKLEKEGLKVILDDREEYTPGWKFNEWELKGIPVRIEIGPKDVKEKRITLVRRDNFKRITVKDTDAIRIVKKTLDDIQKDLFKKATKFLKDHIITVKTFKEFKDVLGKKGGFLRACWCSSQECEEKIKEETGATIRIIPFKKEKIFSGCVYCGKKAEEVVYFAKAY